MALLAGAVVEQIPGRKYQDALRFFEYSPKPPYPRGATLTRLRHGLKEGMVASLRAPKAALVSDSGPLRASEAQEEMLQWTLTAAENLAVRCLVLPTPSQLMPSPRSRDLLARFVDKLPRVEGRSYVWAPAGAWEPEDAQRIAEQLGLVYAFDPLHEDRPPGSVVYAQLTAMGAQTGFSDATLEDVLAKIEAEPYDEAFVSIDAPRSFQHAVRLAQVSRGLDDGL